MLWLSFSTYYRICAYFNSFWISYIPNKLCNSFTNTYIALFWNITMLDNLWRHTDIQLDAVCNRKWQATTSMIMLMKCLGNKKNYLRVCVQCIIIILLWKLKQLMWWCNFVQRIAITCCKTILLVVGRRKI